MALFKGIRIKTDTERGGLVDSEQFGEWLVDEMAKRKLNCNQLAKLTGLSPVTIGFYITQTRSPTFGTLKILLDAFDKHIEIVDN